MISPQSALAVAFLNIQIPLQLGHVVNVLSGYTSETVGNFLEDIKKPALKLISLYGVQACLICCIFWDFCG